MARQILGPRKQRTRQHVIADQSVNYVERFIIDEGHQAVSRRAVAKMRDLKWEARGRVIGVRS